MKSSAGAVQVLPVAGIDLIGHFKDVLEQFELDRLLGSVFGSGSVLKCPGFWSSARA